MDQDKIQKNNNENLKQVEGTEKICSETHDDILNNKAIKDEKRMFGLLGNRKQDEIDNNDKVLKEIKAMQQQFNESIIQLRNEFKVQLEDELKNNKKTMVDEIRATLKYEFNNKKDKSGQESFEKLKRDMVEDISRLITNKMSNIIIKDDFRTYSDKTNKEVSFLKERMQVLNDNFQKIAQTINGFKTSSNTFFTQATDSLNIINNSIKEMKNSSRDNKENFDVKITRIQNKLKDIDNIIAEQNDTVNKKIKEEIIEPLQTIIGRTNKLENIEQILSDKNLKMKKEIPSFNHEDEIICGMTECVDEILDQLKLGARWYARSKNDIDNIRQERTENEKRILEQKEIAYTTGEGQGKQDVIEKLLGQFNDIDKLMKKGNCDNYEESVIGMIASFLRDNGLESEFEVGEEVEISVENSSDIQNKIRFDELGKYRIIKPCYILNEKVYAKAEVEKIVSDNVDENIETNEDNK